MRLDDFLHAIRDADHDSVLAFGPYMPCMSNADFSVELGYIGEIGVGKGFCPIGDTGGVRVLYPIIRLSFQEVDNEC